MQDCTWKYQSKRTVFPPLGLASTVFATCQHRVSYSTQGHHYLCVAREGNRASRQPAVCHWAWGVPQPLIFYLVFREDWSDVPALKVDIYMYLQMCMHTNKYRHQCNALYLSSSSAACLGRAGLSSEHKGKEIKRDLWRWQAVWMSLSLWKWRISGSRKHCCFIGSDFILSIWVLNEGG